MIRLEHPGYTLFIFSALVPVAAFIWYLWWRNRAFNKLGDRKLIERIIPGYSKDKPVIKFVVTAVAFILIIIGAANPQWGSVNKSEKKQGIDVAIVMDVSNSMLSLDVKPDRLTVAKQFATELINQLPDNRLTLITFAGQPFLQLPLTPDHAAIQMMVDDASGESAPMQGTDLGSALTTAVHSLPDNQNHYKAIVLITDGEDNENKVNDALREVNDAHIIICTASVGTTKGSFIPDNMPKRKSQFIKDKNGSTVVSKMNPDLLKRIALKTNGIYVDASLPTGNPAGKIISRLNGVQKNVYDKQLFVQYESRFQYFLLAALLLMIADLFISNKKQQWVWKKTISKTTKITLVLISFILLTSADTLFAQTPGELIAQGNKEYEQNNYTEALQLYQQAIDKDATHQLPQALFNLGNVFYSEKKYSEAALEYEQFLHLDITSSLKAQAYFNLGNCYLAQKKYEQSVVAYKNAINVNSNDNDARYNLAYALAMLNNKQQEQSKKQPPVKSPKEKKQPPKKDENMSQEQVSQLLQSLNQSEEKTLDKIKQENALNHINKLDKNW